MHRAAPAGVAIDPRLDIVFQILLGCLSASAACPDRAAARTAGINGYRLRVRRHRRIEACHEQRFAPSEA